MTKTERITSFFARLRHISLDDFYREQEKIYYFLHSDNATIDGKPIAKGEARYWCTVLTTTTADKNKVLGNSFEIPALRAEFDQMSIYGVPITEQDFVEDELKTVAEMCDGVDIDSVHLRSSIRAYKEKLQKRLDDLSQKLTEEPEQLRVTTTKTIISKPQIKTTIPPEIVEKLRNENLIISKETLQWNPQKLSYVHFLLIYIFAKHTRIVFGKSEKNCLMLVV